MATKTTQKKATPKEGGGHFFAVRILEKFITWIRSKLTANLLELSIKWLSIIGHYALIASAAIGFLFFIIMAIRSNSFFAFLYGIAWILLVFVIQYTAYRFGPAGEKLIKNNPTKLASRAFLDCVAFLALLGGVIYFVMNLVESINRKNLTTFLVGLGVFVFLEFVALIAFNPETVSMEIVDEASAGEEAIGIVTFFLKKLLRLVPIAFGVGVVVFTIILFIDMFKLFGDQFRFAMNFGVKDGTQILMFALLPFASYLAFVVYFLVVDVVRSILVIPGKLDKLKK